MPTDESKKWNAASEWISVRTVVALLVGVTSGGASGTLAGTYGAEAEIAALTKSVNTLNQQVAVLEVRITSFNQRINEGYQDRVELQKEVSRIHSRITKVENTTERILGLLERRSSRADRND